MHNRIGSIVGGIGLFAAMLGFLQAALAPNRDAGEAWGAVMAFGLVAFLLYAFASGFGRPDKS